jgi:hypothetical protein
MTFFLHQVLKGKSTVLHNVYIKKIEKVSKVNPSSSNTIAFDLIDFSASQLISFFSASQLKH